MAVEKKPSQYHFFFPTVNNEIDLENIDEEMRMEQVRQSGAKVEWSELTQIVRRNLQDKRNTLDADGRIDVLNGIAFMKTRLPIDHTAPIKEKLKIFSESLGMTYKLTDDGWTIIDELNNHFELCYSKIDEEIKTTMAFWGEPLSNSETATKMLENGEWTELRDMIQKILAIYDKAFDNATWEICRDGMRMLEMMFKNSSSDDSYAAINGPGYGYYLPRDDLRAGRLYYFATPFHRSTMAKEKVFNLRKKDWDVLPYFEISFITHDGECLFPEYNESGDMEETKCANAAIRLKLSRGVVISQATRRKLARFTAKAATVKHYINCYRYLSQAVRLVKNRNMITQWPGHKGQQLYTIVPNTFVREGDSVITEIFLKRLQDLQQVIDILRREAMHMYLWEGVLAACCEHPGVQEHVETVIPITLYFSRSEIALFFQTNYAPIKVVITENACVGSNVRVMHAMTGMQIAERIDEIASRELNKHGSIPVMLTYIVSMEDCRLLKVTVPLKDDWDEVPPVKKE